ncbi:hypothetical protein [Streptomyces carpaticus]|uniref:YbaB/EbfC family DNA-binding protein n=1 Tax=Streptomyces carpaticus TaxID=285558 RepID=A0ABV4ZU44_9ACTN
MAVHEEAVGTRLNGWDEGPGSADAAHAGMFDLETDTGTLTLLATESRVLGNQLTRVVLPALQEDGEETGAALESEAALRSVLSAWRDRLGDVAAECARLDEGFTAAAGGFAEAEAGARAELQRAAPSWAGEVLAEDGAR